MTNLVIVTGSTVADAVSQGNALKAGTDWVSNLNLIATSAEDLSATGLQVTLSFVKNGGRFAGHQGHKNVTLVGTTGSLTQIATALTPAANDFIVDLAIAQIGSSTTGSVTYYGVMAKTLK